MTMIKMITVVPAMTILTVHNTVSAVDFNVSHVTDLFLKFAKLDEPADMLEMDLDQYHVTKMNNIYKNFLQGSLVNAVFHNTDPFGRPVNRDIFGGSMMDNLLIDVQEVSNYGCHCLFGEHWKLGRNKPVNEIDTFCKDLMYCYKCIEMDEFDVTGNLELVCDPVYEEYAAPSLVKVQEDGVFSACSAVNGGDGCKTRVCACDVNFVNKLLRSFYELHQGNSLDREPQHEGHHDGATFDFESRCLQVNTPVPEKRCCGSYPSRFPYGVKANRACCEPIGKTYDPTMLTCCTVSPTEGHLQIGGVC